MNFYEEIKKNHEKETSETIRFREEAEKNTLYVKNELLKKDMENLDCMYKDLECLNGQSLSDGRTMSVTKKDKSIHVFSTATLLKKHLEFTVSCEDGDCILTIFDSPPLSNTKVESQNFGSARDILALVKSLVKSHM
jgi:hypothetical protein